MPKRLLARLNPDSIAEFRSAERERYEDGSALAAAGRGTGAVYLWDYTAEMLLKAACFSLIGMSDSDPLTMAGHIEPAIRAGLNMKIAWSNRGRGARRTSMGRTLGPYTCHDRRLGLRELIVWQASRAECSTIRVDVERNSAISWK